MDEINAGLPGCVLLVGQPVGVLALIDATQRNDGLNAVPLDSVLEFSAAALARTVKYAWLNGGEPLGQRIYVLPQDMGDNGNDGDIGEENQRQELAKCVRFPLFRCLLFR